MDLNRVLVEINSSDERIPAPIDKLSKILGFSKAEFLTDFEITLENDSNPELPHAIKANKNILAVSSKYFLKQFQENPELNSIKLKGYKIEAAVNIFEYIYNNCIKINQNHLVDTIRLSKLLELDDVTEKVCDYLKSDLDLTIALTVRNNLLSLDQMEEVQVCNTFIRENFEGISNTTAFLEMKIDYLLELLDSDNLMVNDEKQVYEIVIKWMKEDIENRREHSIALLSKVRFPLISTNCLLQMAGDEFIQDNMLSLQRITQSLHYSLTKTADFENKVLRSVDFLQRNKKNLVLEPEMFQNIMCLGGAGTDGALEVIEFSKDDGKTWVTHDKMVPNRLNFAACGWKEFVILIGGHGADMSCMQYDPWNKSFSELADLPELRYSHDAAIMASTLFVCGGGMLKTQKSMISLNLNDPKAQWKQHENMIHKRNGLVMCTVNGLIYCFGGIGSNTCECYTPRTKKWTLLLPMKEERCSPACSFDGKQFIYIVGGYDYKADKCLSTAERFDLYLNQWSTLSSSIGVGRYELTLTNFVNKLFLIGGSDIEGNRYDNIQLYQTEEDKWIDVGKLSFGRYGHCCVSFEWKAISNLQFKFDRLALGERNTNIFEPIRFKVPAGNQKLKKNR